MGGVSAECHHTLALFMSILWTLMYSILWTLICSPMQRFSTFVRISNNSSSHLWNVTVIVILVITWYSWWSLNFSGPSSQKGHFLPVITADITDHNKILQCHTHHFKSLCTGGCIDSRIESQKCCCSWGANSRPLALQASASTCRTR